MKYFFGIIFILITSCSGTKRPSSHGDDALPPPHINCPEDGNCSFEVFKESNLKLAYDSSGKLFPDIIKGDKIVIKYHYKRRKIENTADSDYSEYVYFEVDPNKKQVILKDSELQQVKMIFGRICYCKGSMGYFPIKEGSLFLFNSNGNLQVKTSFKIHKVPQIIEQIDENIKF
ncbi:hypothetical protein [Lutimonas sp.]|uniref:hypothetical protein n=1 Tax=Lutimonas sp. TaxID=1872403 RepID=UPI003D9B16D1